MAAPPVQSLIPALLLGAAAAAPAAVRWDGVLSQPAAWYAGAGARTVADSVLLYQTDSGGWPKNIDMTAPPTAEFLADTRPDHRAPTIDNDATTTQVWLLARVATALAAEGGGESYRTAVLRGLDYLLAAQYDNGGWPQYFPLRPGYYTRITYNDDAMVNVLEVLREVAAGRAPFAFVDAARRARASNAVEKGIDCILRTQVRQDGRLTAWCAQHDEATLEPAWARNFEPPSLSGMETVGIVRFLLSLEDTSPEIIASVEAAAAWLESVGIHGLRIDGSPGDDGRRDRHATADAAAPVLWARFYELGTNRPIFTGRDKVVRYDFNEIERERRTGYNYFGNWPASLLARDYPRWRQKHNLTSRPAAMLPADGGERIHTEPALENRGPPFGGNFGSGSAGLGRVMKTSVHVELPPDLVAEAREMVAQGWAGGFDELLTEALRRYLDSHTSRLAEQYVREDVDSGLGGHG